MRMIVARAEINRALDQALAVASNHIEAPPARPGPQQKLQDSIDAAELALVDSLLRQASRHLQQFQEAAHGA